MDLHPGSEAAPLPLHRHAVTDVPGAMEAARDDRLRITVHSSFSAAAEAWRRVEEAGVCYAFQSYQWQSCWHRCVGRASGVLPCLVAVEDADTGPLLFLPLGVERRLGLTRLTWLGGRAADYHGPILGPGLTEYGRRMPFPELWRRIRARLPPVDVIHFSKQPEWIEDRPNPFAALSTRREAKSAHTVALAGDWGALYLRACGKKTIATDRRKERRLAEVGAVALSLPGSLPDDRFTADAVMDTLFDLKRARYRRTGALDALRTSGVRDFYRRLATAGDGALRVHLSFIRVGDGIAAVHWGVLYRGRFHYLVPAFDEDRFRGASPGALQVRRLLEWSCDHGVRVFDFGLGDEPYKDRWCDSTLHLWELLAPVTLIGRAYVARAAAERSVKALVHRSPVLERLVPMVKRIVNAAG